MAVAMLDRFFAVDIPSALRLPMTHDPWLVGLSVLVAVLASSLALQLAATARTTSVVWQRRTVVIMGSCALGAGIWAMHFIGMLALGICATVRYDVDTTLVSMLPGLLASWVAFWLLARPAIQGWQVAAGGAIVGAGIGAMHYTGMAAMRMAPALRYHPAWFAVSVVVAVVLAMLALWLCFGVPRTGRWARVPSALSGGVAMGLAICGMHYAAMGAARFVGQAEPAAVRGEAGANVPLALEVALVSLLVALLVGQANSLLRRRQSMRRIVRGEARLRAIVDTAVDGVVTVDGGGVVRDFNGAAERLFGWHASEVLGRDAAMLMASPRGRQRRTGALARMLRAAAARPPHGPVREAWGRRKDGGLVPVRLAVGRADIPGEPLFVGLVADISAQRQAEAQLRVAASVFDNSCEAILIADAGRRIVQANPACLQTLGYAPAQLAGRPLDALFEDRHDAAFRAALWASLDGQGFWRGELWARNAAGAACPQQVALAAVRDGRRQLQHYIAALSDISQIKAHEAELERIALFDPLTGLPNRRLLLHRLEQSMALAAREGRMLALCYLDLDGFKQVNDLHGHEAGDQLLAAIANRLLDAVRREDTVARIGGDEMVLLLGELVDAAACGPLLDRVLQAAALPVALSAGLVQVSASIGVSLYPLDADNAETLLRQADHAMYLAKQAGKNRVQWFGALGLKAGWVSER